LSHWHFFTTYPLSCNCSALFSLQSGASAMLAPALRYVTDALALSWRRQLTTVAHRRYLSGSTFYAASQLAGMQACHSDCHLCMRDNRCEIASSAATLQGDAMLCPAMLMLHGHVSCKCMVTGNLQRENCTTSTED